MKRLAIVFVLALLVVALAVPAMAPAAPDAGQGCHCHKMYGQAAADGLHNAFMKSGGKNANSAVCMQCH